jgi:hypothetical protein
MEQNYVFSGIYDASIRSVGQADRGGAQGELERASNALSRPLA